MDLRRFIYKSRKTLCYLPKCFRRQSSDMVQFKQILKKAKNVVVLSGAGMSKESGIPTFRGTEGLWRKMEASLINSLSTFRDDPSLVWEFYHYTRELVGKLKPNAGHIAIAEYEARHATTKSVSILTQNVDGLHARAGSKYVVEIHGNLFKTRCTKCDEVLVNTDSPICQGLAGSGSPYSEKLVSDIPIKDLPHCKKPDCGGLLRPHIVWFGESLDPATVEAADAVIKKCNVCLVVGTSSLVYPVAAYPVVMAAGGSILAEFNIGPGPFSRKFDFYFEGPSAKTLPIALSD